MIPWHEIFVVNGVETGLRPEGVGRDEYEGETFWYAEGKILAGNGKPKRLEIPDESASALCFAQAVVWVQEQGLVFTVCRMEDVPESRVDIGQWKEHGGIKALVYLAREYAATPEAAAFAACKALIADRFATSPSGTPSPSSPSSPPEPSAGP